MYYVITKIYMCRIFFLLLLHTDKTHQCAEVDVVLTIVFFRLKPSDGNLFQSPRKKRGVFS